MSPDVIDRLRSIVGEAFVRTDENARRDYGVDALKRGAMADVVVFPIRTDEIAAVARLCDETRTPLVPRGGGTGFTGGAVPVRGGVVLSLERMNRILEIDPIDLVAVVEPNVITGDLQDAVEAVGLFYPPDPSSLRLCAIGGNVAECAGGPRAFKYGVTRQYVLGLQAVLPTGEVVRTGGRVVKNVVGYDLTQLLVGSEGTLAIVTEITLRLIPLPPAAATLRATFASVDDAVSAVIHLVRERVVPSTMELVDRDSLEAVGAALGTQALAPKGTGAVLIIEVDGLPEQVAAEAERVVRSCLAARATEVLRAATPDERRELWRVRREISASLMRIAPRKFNHDIVVPKSKIGDLMRLVDGMKTRFGFAIPCFGHVGDGNIHVNIMSGDDEASLARAHEAEGVLFRGVIGLGGAITGEHGVGFVKAKYLDLALDAETIALMKRVKQAFDPRGILNPGKIFTDAAWPS